MISRLDFLIDSKQIFKIFGVFGHLSGECFGANVCENGGWKNNRKNSEKRMRAGRFAAEAGLSGGGEASPRSFASMCFAYCPALLATSERGAADDGSML